MDDLGDRIKLYEHSFSQVLPIRLPVIIRVDGRSFHRFTRGMKKPFDDDFRDAMAKTAMVLCKEISGAKIAYSQSDEISILLTNDDSIETQPWFRNEINKLVSISASLATVAFNRLIIEKWREKYPHFDSRVFIIPSDDINNYFVWRQKDWERNSLNMLARSHFSQKQIHGLKRDEIHEKLWKEKSVNWNDLPTKHKRGICVIPDVKGWKIDEEIPIFTQDRKFISSLLVKDGELNGSRNDTRTT